MKDYLGYLIILIVAVALVIAASGYNAARQTQRAHAEAAVIRAQSQARLDATSAHLPYVVLGTGLIIGGGLVLLGCVVVWSTHHGNAQHVPPTRVIETRIIERYVVVLPEGRRAMWERLIESGEK